MKYKSKASVYADAYENKTRSLEPMRAELRELVRQANEMISRLKAAGATSEDNAALAEAERSLTKSKERKSNELFSVDDKHRFRELRRESDRLGKFLSSAQADVAVYLNEKQALDAVSKYNITFQNQHENFIKSGFRFSVDDQERFKKAASIYRMVEETYASVIYGDDKSRFGSDNLINLIYSQLEGYNPYAPDNIRLSMEANAKQVAERALQRHRDLINMGFFSGTASENIDIGVIEKMKNSMSASEFLEMSNFSGDNLE